MKMTKNQKKAILEAKVKYKDLVAMKARETLIETMNSLGKEYALAMGVNDIKTEKKFREWAGYAKKDELTIQELLNLKVHPHFTFWVLYNSRLLPDNLLHHWTLQFCQDFLGDLSKSNAFVDYRFDMLLEAKRRYIKNASSLGNLNHAFRKSLEILMDSVISQDDKIIASAQAVNSALFADPAAAFKGVFEAIKSVSSVKKEYVRQLNYVKNELSQS